MMKYLLAMDELGLGTFAFLVALLIRLGALSFLLVMLLTCTGRLGHLVRSLVYLAVIDVGGLNQAPMPKNNLSWLGLEAMLTVIDAALAS